MPLSYYMDHNVPRSITVGLRLREVDVITAYEDGAHLIDDSSLLDRASDLKRVLFTCDDDLLVEASARQREGTFFHGVIYIHPLRVSIGACINDLEIIAKVGEAEDLINEIQHLPL